MGLLISAGALGYSVFQLPAGWLIDRFGVRRMLVAGTFAAGAIILSMLLASSLPVAFAVLFIGGFGYMAVDYSLVTYLIIYLNESVGVAVALAGVFLALTNVGGLLGKLSFGLMSDRVFGGSRKKPLLLAGCMMLVVSVVVQFVGPGTPGWAIALVFAAFGFSAIGWGGMNLILVSESVRKEVAGLAMGYSLMILLIGNIVGPPVFGYIVDTTGSYSPAWWFLTACSVGAVALMVLVRERKHA